MIKTEIEYDELKVDLDKFTENELIIVGERAMLDVMGLHDKQYQKGKGPDGKTNKLSKAYKEAKVRSGRAAKADFLFSGKLLTNRVVETVGSTIVSYFTKDEHPPNRLKPKTDIKRKKKQGSRKRSTHAQIAAGLVEMGKSFHFFSKKDIKHIEKIYEAELEKKLNDSVKITRVKKPT